MCSVGVKPTEERVRNLVAWAEGERENRFRHRYRHLPSPGIPMLGGSSAIDRREDLHGRISSIVTGMDEWGPWVNGGAWIQTPVGKVDFLYRNLDQVQAVSRKDGKGYGVTTTISSRRTASEAWVTSARRLSVCRSMIRKGKSLG